MVAILKTAVCTLFEGKYHFGVGALTNSLYANGFRGVIYAGYRGELPSWAQTAKVQSVGKWGASSVLLVAQGLELVFLPLETEYHLTNYKPDFLLELFDDPACDVDAIFYFDPDIVVNEKWSFFEEWVQCGIALCEDVNSPLPRNHPRRVGWRTFYGKSEIPLTYINTEYVNGGFQGVLRTDRAFIEQWQLLQQKMFPFIGGPNAAGISGGKSLGGLSGFADCFGRTDQDALNACIEACDVPVSMIGQEAMGFKPGAAVVPHSLGSRKPWNANYLLSSMSGKGPALVDKLFWNHVSSPIVVKPKVTVFWKRLEILITSFVSRFYRRA